MLIQDSVLYRILVYSRLGLYRILVYSGFDLDRFIHYRILVYSWYGLDRFVQDSGLFKVRFIQGLVYTVFWFIQG